MLTKFKVENFKSIHSLELELGRVNVFIGENGSGKSNVLEAVALGYAALQGKLGDEFWVPRGIRVTKPDLMRSAFEVESTRKEIEFDIEFEDRAFTVKLANQNGEYDAWTSEVDYSRDPGHQAALESATSDGVDFEDTIRRLNQYVSSIGVSLGDFLTFCPENSSLRNFQQEGQIKPLGVFGEGLFKLLKKFATESNQPVIRELNERLQLFGWFDSFALPERLWPGESFLKIKDKFLDANIEFIDQRSTNEGFLFVLFYLSLFISKDTPKCFAIDNLDISLNPKMCTMLMSTVAELAKSHDKQVMITTHSPAILDGINLNDDEQRLFVVYRNAYGHTVVRRVSKPQPLPGQVPAKLSELFMMGHLGGLPKNFSL